MTRTPQEIARELWVTVVTHYENGGEINYHAGIQKIAQAISAERAIDTAINPTINPENVRIYDLGFKAGYEMGRKVK